MEFVRNLSNFYYDPLRQGYDTGVFASVLGTAPTIVSDELVFNGGGAITRFDMGRGEITMRLKIPVGPTSGDDRAWGLTQASNDTLIAFNTENDEFSIKVRNGDTVESLAVDWLAGWTNTSVDWTISWDPSGAKFYANGQLLGFLNLDGAVPQVPLSLVIINENSDAMTLSNIQFRNVEVFESSSSTNAVTIASGIVTVSYITPGTAADALGKAEDAVHASGDTGVMALGVSNEAQADLVSADGDYTPPATTKKGNVFIENTRYDRAVDNSNDIYWTHQRALSTATGAVAKDNSAALEASSIAKATFGRLYRTMGRLDATAGSATFYLQFLDSATLPADGAVTHIMAPIKFVHTNGTDQTWDIDLGSLGVPFNSGCVVVLSSTEFTKTIAGAYLSSTNLVG